MGKPETENPIADFYVRLNLDDDEQRQVKILSMDSKTTIGRFLSQIIRKELKKHPNMQIVRG